ncbi:hypothetical protein L1987_21643 [Smallanthus sonchifolius]|uniref:Uncharacterized protein n=1 Tax=Smallanthus sonchifolius TaxID=185202 RepID=A0ACB9IDZ0_9ASTR|nr:hypothetical protein L1987_21643 [Smallanthus sonchifolius]
MASEITEDEDSYFITNKEAQKDKIRQLLKRQKNQYNSSSSSTSSSSYSLLSTGATLSSSRSSFDNRQSQKLLNLMKKGSRSLRRLFEMEHTSLGNHFEFYSGSPETKTIPLWGSDSDDAVHDDPWLGIIKFDRGFVQEPEEHQEQKKEEHDESLFRKDKLTRKKSFNKLPSFYKFRFRFRFRLRLKLRIRFCYREKKKKYVSRS